MSVPSDRKYSQSHEWFLVEGDAVRIGITKHAADELTDITFVSLPQVGKNIEAGKAFGEVESVKATSELFSAVGGEIIEVNGQLADHPELVNNDSLGQGWMIRVRASSLKPLDALLDAAGYEAMIAGA
jgi:glycine cleavage system H protein